MPATAVPRQRADKRHTSHRRLRAVQAYDERERTVRGRERAILERAERPLGPDADATTRHDAILAGIVAEDDRRNARERLRFFLAIGPNLQRHATSSFRVKR
jgi:hypothetical protein